MPAASPVSTLVSRAILLFAVSAFGGPADDSNSFAERYNAWVKLRNAGRPGTISAVEVRTWREVKSAWRAFEKRVDAEYRGDR